MTRLLACLALGLVAVPLGMAASGGGHVPRIGILFTGSPPPEANRGVEAFRRGLRELGYVEGQNIALEYRWAAEAEAARLPDLAAELVRAGVDVILAQTVAHTLAAKRATSTIPIVMGAVSDPVGSALVASLAHPGGNVTGSSLLSPQVAGKLLELLKEAVPKASRVAALQDPAGSIRSRIEVETVARVLGVQLQTLEVRDRGDLDRVFQLATAGRAQAVITIPSPFFASHRAGSRRSP